MKDATDRQTDMDGLIRCSLLTQEREEHLERNLVLLGQRLRGDDLVPGQDSNQILPDCNEKNFSLTNEPEHNAFCFTGFIKFFEVDTDGGT
jgi:hypothetical protein